MSCDAISHHYRPHEPLISSSVTTSTLDTRSRTIGHVSDPRFVRRPSAIVLAPNATRQWSRFCIPHLSGPSQALTRRVCNNAASLLHTCASRNAPCAVHATRKRGDRRNNAGPTFDLRESSTAAGSAAIISMRGSMPFAGRGCSNVPNHKCAASGGARLNCKGDSGDHTTASYRDNNGIKNWRCD